MNAVRPNAGLRLTTAPHHLAASGAAAWQRQQRQPLASARLGQPPALRRAPTGVPSRCCGRGGLRRVPAARPAASLSGGLVGVAAKAAAALPFVGAGLAGALDPGVLAATLNASAKLFLICSTVGWLLRTGRIPNSSATVLSKVSFELLIPAMLFSKVASTLAAQPDATLLLGIAAAALTQICIGAACGLLLARLPAFRPEPSAAAAAAQERLGGGDWRGRTSPDAAAAIALSVAGGLGAPAAAAALRAGAPPPAGGLATMVPAAAAFGNSFTLPAVFLTTLLPRALADRALGYAALFLLAWSPCLWSIGLALVGSKPGGPAPAQGGAAGSSLQGRLAAAIGGAAAPARQQEGGGENAGEAAAPKPLPWRQPRVVDVTPVDAPIRSASGRGGLSAGATGLLGAGASALGEALEPAEAAPLNWAERLAAHALTCRMLQFAAQVLNPPVLAIVAGAAVGLTPAGRALIAASRSTGAAAAGAAAALPPELGLVHALARAALEVVELLAQGTLATQTLVLAASLLQQPEAAAAVGPAALATSAAAQRRGPLGSLRRLLPEDEVEARALAVLSLTRFLLLPLATLGVLQALVSGGLLPPALCDPLLLFVILVQAVMPSAQNLIILLQLSERTQALAPGFARLLLKLYAYAVLPVTLWVTAFATNLGIPVLR